ncbi:hypothetical protein [Pseudomonas putida]|uniref:hypothetical protein n=1 Tax=Pseudomonas putida TaxID=303 RepID=UPI000951325C|nr:hypothetical protein [Pseudomonas putida]
MKMLEKAVQLIRNESKRPWSEVNSWALALIGGPSFVIGSYYAAGAVKVTPDLMHATDQVGLTALGIAAYSATGLMAVAGWHFLKIAQRCSELLYQRHYR